MITRKPGANINGKMLVQKADQNSPTSDTSFVDVDDLFFPVKINTAYLFKVFGKNRLSAGVLADIKYTFTVPTNATCKWSTSYGNTFIMFSAGVSSGSINATINDETTMLWGIIIVGDTPGNLQMQFGQATSDPASARIKKHSTMQFWELQSA